MERFGSVRAERVYQWAEFPGIPLSIGKKAHRIIRRLVATTIWQDVLVVRGKNGVMRQKGVRFGIHIEGKWFVTFLWEDMVGPKKIDIQRW